MLYQIFLSSKVKRIVIISNKHGIYEFPDKLQNNLRLRILGNQDILRRSQIFIELQPSGGQRRNLQGCMACFSYLNRTYLWIGYPIYRQGLLWYQKYATAQYLNACDDSLSSDRMSYLQLPDQLSESTADLLQALYNCARTCRILKCTKYRTIK